MKKNLLDDPGIVKQINEEYPRKDLYPNTFYDGEHSCGRRVVYCNGVRDIVRCELCGYEKEVACNFDDEY